MAGGPRDPRPGDLVGGHRIERPLGAGAMGTVWLAEHVTLGRRVALKILAHGLADDPSFQDRFMREARLAARLDHPNVVAVYDAGTDDAGLWLSMRFVEGEDLRKRLNRVAAAAGDGPAPARDATGPGRPAPSSTAFRRPEPAASAEDPTVALGRDRRPPGGLPPGEAIGIVEGVAAGLDHAHSRGILHRDVKPGNVLLEAEDGHVPTPAPPVRGDGPAILELPPFQRVLLADFGLTKELEEATDLTQTGMLLGSADSVAPEQIEGHDSDGRVDVYALGSLLYVALTGAAPFPGATMAKLFAHVNGERPRASDAFPQLRAFDSVIAAGMAIDPAERPGTAGELAALARAALERSDVDPQATVAFPGPAPVWPAPRTTERPKSRGTDRLANLDQERTPRPRPVPPVPGVAPPVRMREEPTPAEPRTRALPQDGRTRVAPAVGQGVDRDPATGSQRRAAAGPATGAGGRDAGPPTGRQPRAEGVVPVAARPGGTSGPPPPSSGDPSRTPGGTPPWLVPALVVGALAIALVVVLALALGGGSDPSPSPRADTGTTTERTTSTEQEPADTPAQTPAEQPTETDPPATTSTEDAPPADGATQVRGGGTIVAGAATRDPAAGQPLAGDGVAADYSAPGAVWGTLIVRPTGDWSAPRRSSQGSALMRLRQQGPEGRLILVDFTPTQAASFDTANVLETRQIAGTRFGDVPGYRFQDGRIGSIPECARLQCVDVPLNQSPDGPGWGVLVAAPTAEEAWATAERVAKATGP